MIVVKKKIDIVGRLFSFVQLDGPFIRTNQSPLIAIVFRTSLKASPPCPRETQMEPSNSKQTKAVIDFDTP